MDSILILKSLPVNVMWWWTLVFFALLVNCVVSGKMQDQFHASCFPGCRCNDTVIECNKLGESTTELFRHIRSDIYPDLDTLIITGNNFGDLPNENIFGENIRHRKLNFVNISNNGIRSFGSQTFIGMSRVEYLYLDNNALNQVVDDEPLRFFPSLKLLSMNRIFGDHISVKARAEFISHILTNDHKFVDLNEIILTNNRIDHLKDNTFCAVKGLTQLRLSNNQLQSFDLDCLVNLHMLDLSNNRLTTISSKLWKDLPSLDTVDFSRNPLVCDCELEPFHKYALEEVNAFLNQEATICAKPVGLAGKKLFDLNENSNLCRYGGGFSRWFFLLLFAIGVIVSYYCYRDKFNYIEKFNLRRAKSQLKTPLILEGYSQLRSNDEMPAPAFV